jgi:two-component system sensor histidine kinase DesK
VAPRLARVTLVVVLGANAAILLSNILVAGGAPLAMAAAAGTIVTVSALQLHHSLGWRAGSRPYAWRWTLTAQTLLPFAWLPAYDWNVLTLAGTAAGSALLLLPRRWAWTAFAAVLASVGLAWALPVLGLYYGIGNRDVFVVATDNATILYQIGAAATAGIVVYGLSRLTDLAEQVQAVRRGLARAAVERERLRVAQDTHDLLGLGLSAVALKCDLAGRLIGRDDARARGELEALLRLAAQARAEIRSVTTGEHGLSLRAELTAAGDVLASAGIAAEVRPETPGGQLPEEIDAVLATVLREAVTNILRHSTATRCKIELTVGEGAARLRVANDGVTDERGPERAPERPGGHGLANLSARAEALGGRLSARAEDGRFELAVRVPLPAVARA